MKDKSNIQDNRNGYLDNIKTSQNQLNFINETDINDKEWMVLMDAKRALRVLNNLFRQNKYN